MKSLIGFAGILVPISLSVPGNAQDISVSLSLNENTRVETSHYVCGDGTEKTVRYLSGGSNQLALFSVNEESLVFVNVISGSGSRYVSGPYEWWTKGNEGTLTNTTSEDEQVQCTEKVVGAD